MSKNLNNWIMLWLGCRKIERERNDKKIISMKLQSFDLCIPKYHIFSKKVVCLPYMSFKFSPLFGEYGNKLARKNNNSWLLFSKSAKKVSVSWGLWSPILSFFFKCQKFYIRFQYGSQEYRSMLQCFASHIFS